MDISGLNTALDGTDPALLLLKRACRVLVKAAGGLEAAAEITGKSPEQMRRYGDPSLTDSLPVWLAARLEAETGQPYLTRALAGLAGQELRPLGAQVPGTGLRKAFAAASLAAAEFHREFAIAEADGVITPNEQSAISTAGARVQAATGHVMAALAGVVPPSEAPPPSPSSHPVGGEEEDDVVRLGAGIRPGQRSNLNIRDVR